MTIINVKFNSGFNIKQETSEDGKAGLLQFDLENRQYKGLSLLQKSLQYRNLLLETFRLSFKFIPLFIAQILLHPETLTKMVTDGRTSPIYTSNKVYSKC